MKIHTTATCSLATILLLASTAGTALAVGVKPAAGIAASRVQADSDKVGLAVDMLEVVGRSNRIGRADPNRLMHVSVSLPPADIAALERFADSVSDPKDPNFRQFITPEEVGARFGLPAERVQAVADWLKSQGLNVTLVAKNRMAILCEGTVSQFEAAFSTTIDQYVVDPVLAPAVEGGNKEFIAPSTQLKAPASIAGCILDVFGLDTYVKPQPRMALTPTQTRGLYNSAPAFSAGYTGVGRVCAISNFDGFRLTNVPLYYSYYGLPTPAGGVNSNVHTVVVGTAAGTGTAQGEGDLDIQMVLGMAPLCEFYIYDSTIDLVGVLTREVNDNLADVISESYGWNITATTANSAHNQHLSMSAQGITYMCASGDSGTTIGSYAYPDFDPEVLMVGGTVATVNGSNVRSTEVGWSGSGGGWVTRTDAFNKLPSWQVGNGVPTTINYRLIPDLALHANGGTTGAFPYYFNGARTTAYSGTSFSSPVFCGMLAISEQKLIALNSLPANAAGKRRLGRIQNVVYGLNGNSSVFYDVTSGSNGTLPAAINGSTSSTCKVGWDTVTGWGAMNMDGFVTSQKVVPPCPSDLDHSGSVDGADVGMFLVYWGATGTGVGPADLNGDGVVNGSDLAYLLGAWGACPQ